MMLNRFLPVLILSLLLPVRGADAQTPLYSNDFEGVSGMTFKGCYGPEWISSLDQAKDKGLIKVNRIGLTDPNKGKSHSGVSSFMIDVELDKCSAKWGPFFAWAGPRIKIPLDKPVYFSGFAYADRLPPGVEIIFDFYFTGVRADTGKPVKGSLPIKRSGVDNLNWIGYQADLKQLAQAKGFTDVVVTQWDVRIHSSKRFHGQHVIIYIDDVSLTTKPRDLPLNDKKTHRTQIIDNNPYTVDYTSLYRDFPKEAPNRVHNASFEVGVRSWYPAVRAINDRIQSGEQKRPPKSTIRCVRGDAPHGDRYIKFIRHGEPSFLRLSSAPISIDDGQPYTLSFYAKSSEPTTIHVANRDFKLTTQWKRYVDQIKAIRPFERWNGKSFPGRYILRFDSEGAADICLDAVQLEKGKLTDFAVPRMVDLSVQPMSQYGIWLEGEMPRFQVEAFNGFQGKKQVEIKYEICDTHNRPVFEGQQRLILDAGKGADFEVSVPKGIALHHLKIRAAAWVDGKKGQTARCSIGIVPDLSRIKGNEFFGSLIDNCNAPNMRQILDLNKMAGVHLMEIYHGIDFHRAPQNWRTHNPQWANVSYLLDQLERYGFTPMNTIYHPFPPDVKRGRNGVEIITPKDQQDIYDYCREAARRFAGRIRYWEVAAEYMKSPLEARAKTLRRVFPFAYRGLKDGNPNAYVIACGENGARERQMIKQLEVHFKLGTLAYMDAVSLHPYTKPNGPEWNDLQHQIGELANIIRTYNHGKSKPIWGTESGFQGIDTFYYDTVYRETMYYPRFLSELQQANFTVRQNLILFGEGMAHNFAFYLDGGYDWPYSFVKRGNGVTPKVVYTAYCYLVKALSGATPGKRIEDDKASLLGYLFHKEGAPFASIWLHRPDHASRQAIVHVDPANIKLVSMLGEPIKARGDSGSTVFSLDGSPVFIYPVGLSAGKFAQAIQNIKVEDIDVSIKSVTDRQAVTRITNDTVSPLKGQLNVALPEQWEADGALGVPFDIAAGGEMTHVTKLHLLPRAKAMGRVRVSIHTSAGDRSDSFRYLLCPPLKGPPDHLPDRSLVRLGKSNWVSLYSKARWGGDDDLSADLKTAWDSTNFYVTVDVRDDVHASPFNASLYLWANDALQLSFCPSLAPEKRLEFAASLTPEGPVMAVDAGHVDLSRIKFSAQRTDKGVRYALAMPWSVILPGFDPGRSPMPYFDIAVSDNDGKKSSGISLPKLKGYFQSLELTPGIVTSKDITQYRRLLLCSD